MKNQKNYLLVIVLIIGVSSGLFAQKKPARMPMDSKATFEKFIGDVYSAYYEAFDKKNYKGFVKYFSGNAAEIGPDGKLTYSLKALKEIWPLMDQMMDSKPNFVNKLTSSRFVNSEIAIITWDSEADIMVKGQQVGGKTTNMAVLKKSGENWVIEFDAAVPVIPMPEVAPPPATEPIMETPKN